MSRSPILDYAAYNPIPEYIPVVEIEPVVGTVLTDQSGAVITNEDGVPITVDDVINPSLIPD